MVVAAKAVTGIASNSTTVSSAGNPAVSLRTDLLWGKHPMEMSDLKQRDHVARTSTADFPQALLTKFPPEFHL